MSLRLLPPVRLRLTAPVGHAETQMRFGRLRDSIAFRLSAATPCGVLRFAQESQMISRANLTRKKNELKTPTPSQAAPDSPGGACRNANAFRASPRLHCIPSLRRYALRRIALRAKKNDFCCFLRSGLRSTKTFSIVEGFKPV